MGRFHHRRAVPILLASAVVLVLSLVVSAEEKKGGKQVTLEGKLVCGMCTLGETKACSNVLKVTKDGKTVNYYLKDKGAKESYHKPICAKNSEAEVTVTGTVTEKEGKKWIKPTKVETKK